MLQRVPCNVGRYKLDRKKIACKSDALLNFSWGFSKDKSQVRMEGCWANLGSTAVPTTWLNVAMVYQGGLSF